jgi:murein L,D-transpeptidase YafK
MCTWSGRLGPKLRERDRQSPEGFYDVTPQQMKPNSSYHLAFNVGFPNALDRSLGRTGSLIMVHGKCKSVGCFAMTDRWMEEIYAFVREAFAGGQAAVPVHIFPFRPTASAIEQHASHPAARTWLPLQQAFDDFEIERKPPTVSVCESRYVVNASWAAKPGAPTDACPRHEPRRLVMAAPTITAEGFEIGARPLISAGIKVRAPQPVGALLPTAGGDLGSLGPRLVPRRVRLTRLGVPAVDTRPGVQTEFGATGP